jgi:hypothetical protein
MATISWFSFVCGTQEQAVIPLKSEPHHHLALHNDYVNVYSVYVATRDSVLLHKHEVDAISIVISDSEITVRAPGKPDSEQKVVNGQLRLQSAGYVHSTSVDGATAYRNVTVELLTPQQSPRNLCAAVVLGQPINCPESSPQHEARGGSAQPQFQTDETKVTLIRILPRQSATLDAQGLSQLVIVLDDVSFSGSDNNPRKILHTGDFLWRDPRRAPDIFTNNSANEVRLVSFAFQQAKISNAITNIYDR